MNYDKLCWHCMMEADIAEGEKCPHCGAAYHVKGKLQHQLQPGTRLHEKYLVGDILGEGGFGITYIGFDTVIEARVAIKEFYPNGYATRESAQTCELTIYQGESKAVVDKWKANFIKEARRLGKCANLSGVVGVRDFFEENGTAYIILEFLDGKTLKQYAKENSGKIPAETLLPAIEPVMLSMEEVHKQGIIHRDISPDNIMVLNNGSMKLLDFGAARDTLNNDEKSVSVMLKPGYAPEEQYRSSGNQGNWTDVYALGATIYKCLTGKTPPEAMERLRKDELVPPTQLGARITAFEEKALLKAMAVYAEDRYQSMAEFHKGLYEDDETTVALEDDDRTMALMDDDRTMALMDDDRTMALQDDDRTMALPKAQVDGLAKAAAAGSRQAGAGAPGAGAQGFQRTGAQGFTQPQNMPGGFQQPRPGGPGYGQRPPYPQPQPQKKSGAGIIIAALVAIIAIAGIGGGAYFLMNRDDGGSVSSSKRDKDDEEEGEEGDEGAEGEGKTEEGGKTEAGKTAEGAQTTASNSGNTGTNAGNTGSSTTTQPQAQADPWEKEKANYESSVADAREFLEEGSLNDAGDSLLAAAQTASLCNKERETNDELQEFYEDYCDNINEFIQNYASIQIDDFNAGLYIEIQNRLHRAEKLRTDLKDYGYFFNQDSELAKQRDLNDSRLIEKFDKHQKENGYYSRSAGWNVMGEGAFEEDLLEGRKEDDPIYLRYQYAYAGHLDQQIENGEIDPYVDPEELAKAAYDPALLHTIAAETDDEDCWKLVDDFVELMQQQHYSGFSRDNLQKFGDFYYYRSPGEADTIGDPENGCTPANRKEFIELAHSTLG